MRKSDLISLAVVISFMLVPILLYYYSKINFYKTEKFGEQFAEDYLQYNAFLFYLFPYTDLVSKISVVEGLFHVYNNSSCGHFNKTIPIWIIQDKSDYNKIERCIKNPNSINIHTGYPAFSKDVENTTNSTFVKYIEQMKNLINVKISNIKVKFGGYMESLAHIAILSNAWIFFNYLASWEFSSKYIEHQWTVPSIRIIPIINLIGIFESNYTNTKNKILYCWKPGCWDNFSLNNRSEGNTCNVASGYENRCAQCKEIKKEEPKCKPWFSKIFPKDFEGYFNLSRKRLTYIGESNKSYENSSCIGPSKKITVKYTYDCIFKGSKCGPYSTTIFVQYPYMLNEFTYDVNLSNPFFHITGQTNFVYYANFTYDCTQNNYFYCENGGGAHENLDYIYYTCENKKCVRKVKTLPCNKCCAGCSGCCAWCSCGKDCIYCCAHWTCYWGCNQNRRDCYCHCVCV